MIFWALVFAADMLAGEVERKERVRFFRGAIRKDRLGGCLFWLREVKW